MSQSLHHSFDISLAEIYGVHEAIIIHHFQHWIRINQKLKRNFHEGRTWSYQTLDEIAAHFPYLTRGEVFEIIERLCTGKGRRSKKDKKFEPVLKKGNFNKKKFDQTTWYSFVIEEKFTVLAQANMDVSLSQTPCRPEPTPIPDTKPYTKTNLPPLPPPNEVLDEKPSEEEEEEICRRLKNRPLSAKPITVMREWRKEVLKDIRFDRSQVGGNDNLYDKHKAEAEANDMKQFGDWKAFACEGYVEFASGSQCKQVAYEVSDLSWRACTDKFWGEK